MPGPQSSHPPAQLQSCRSNASSSGGVGRPDPTPRLRSGRSTGISDGNRDGNVGSREQPEAAINSQLLSHV
jgi:hypothetical protein